MTLRLVLAGWLIAELFFFWPSWATGFAKIYGDLGDPRIVLALLEHWWLWLTGVQPWGSPGFFYPQPGLLGHTDAYLLFALPYAAMRALGADMYLAMELSFHAMKAVGYFGMVWLLRAGLAVPLGWAVFGGVLFSVLNGMVWHAIHMQLAAVAVVPWLVSALLRITKGGAGLKVYLGASLGLAALFLTSFYIAWFSVLSLFVFFLIARLLRAVQFSFLLEWRAVLAAITLFVLGMVPFLVLYYPVWLEKQGHAFETVLQQSLYAVELIRVGSHNLLWGWLETVFYGPLGLVTPASQSNYIPDYERISGFTPGLILAFVTALVMLVKAGLRRNLVLAFALTFIFFWLLSSRWWDFTLWQWVYNLVPGATAMRVPSRLLLFLSVFLVPVVVYALSEWHKRKAILPVLLGAFLLLEQVNTGPVHNLSRRDELALISQTPEPPQGCQAFYVSASRPIQTGYTLLDGFYIPNMDAMVLASHWKMPTLNGMSTWAPAGWALEKPASPDYQKAVENWVRLKGLNPKTLCALNMVSNTWAFPAYNVLPLPGLGLGKTELNPKAESPDIAILKKGWSIPEPWGVWSSAGHAQLAFNLAEPAQTLVLNLQAYAAQKDPVRLDIAVLPGGEQFTLTLNESEPKAYSLTLKQALQGEVQLDITIHNPRRPLDDGLDDTRWLGIGLIGVGVK